MGEFVFESPVKSNYGLHEKNQTLTRIIYFLLLLLLGLVLANDTQ